MEGEVTISKDRYFKLRKCEIKLMMLEGGGVDNWDGYDYSLYPEVEDASYDVLCEQEEQRIKAMA